MSRTFPVQPTNIQFAILNFIKNLVTKSIYNDIKILLDPCCKPSLAIAEDFACTGNSYTVFGDVTVSFPKFKNKNVTLLFTFSQPDRPDFISAEVVTLDSKGTWNDSVTMWSWVDAGTATVTVGVIVDGSKVVSTSDPITVTGIPNCD